MGRANRSKPTELPNKLKLIREAFGYSQAQMVVALDVPDSRVYAPTISLFETGKREPSLPVLLKYAKLANVCLEVLADDELNLPKRLPARAVKHLGFYPKPT